MEKRYSLQQAVLEKLDSVCKAIKLEHSLTLYTKWLKDFNIRHDTIKLLEENKDKTLSDINCTDVFLGQSPETKEIKAKISR